MKTNRGRVHAIVSAGEVDVDDGWNSVFGFYRNIPGFYSITTQ